MQHLDIAHSNFNDLVAYSSDPKKQQLHLLEADILYTTANISFISSVCLKEQARALLGGDLFLGTKQTAMVTTHPTVEYAIQRYIFNIDGSLHHIED